MRHVMTALLAACSCALPALAQDEKPVPIEKAAYHWPVFHNDLVMVLRVFFPPGRGSNYHTHTTDQFGVVVATGENSNQVPGGEPSPPRAAMVGSVGYNEFSKKPMTHKSTNLGKTPFHNVVVSLNSPQPAGFTPASRDGIAGYTQVLDNARVRAWRLKLAPGETAAAITQNGPGLRVVVEGGEIAEAVAGEPDRGQGLRPGDFYWQDGHVTRAIKNTGATPIHIVEFELK